MPLPKTSEVGKIMSFLKKEKPGMASDQKTAIALNQARKHGARIPKPDAREEAVKMATS